jgi:glycosyltransferase involved in cell wall biosynthesis
MNSEIQNIDHKINILIIGADDAPGGVAGYVNEIVRLSSEKYLYHMLVSKVKLADSKLHPKIIRHALPIGYNLWSLLRNFFKFREIIKSNKIHILHLHTAGGGLAGCLLSIGLPVKIVFTGHSWRFEQKSNLILLSLYFYYEKFICKKSDVITFLTSRDLKIGVSKGLLNEEKGIAISTRITTTDFQNVRPNSVIELKQSLGIPKDAIVVGNTGYVSERKDPKTFIYTASEVLKTIPNAYFLWVGDGELKEKALELSEKLKVNDKIIFTGFVLSSKIPTYLNAMDVFLFTSHIEGVPLSILEAQAANLPVICAKYIGSGVEELIVDGKTGYLFERGDYSKASENIVSIINDREKRQSLIEKMQIKLMNEHSNPSIMASEYQKIYQELANRKKTHN